MSNESYKMGFPDLFRLWTSHDLGVPGFQRWQAAQDRLEPGEENRELSAERPEIAKKVKLFLGDDYYVEYRPFREISIRDGEVVELDVPSFITDLAR